MVIYTKIKLYIDYSDEYRCLLDILGNPECHKDDDLAFDLIHLKNDILSQNDEQMARYEAFISKEMKNLNDVITSANIFIDKPHTFH